LDSFDQSNRQSECPAQLRFLARHLTIIALVIKPRQMENSMKHENLDFLGNRMPEPYGTLQGDVRGNGDVSSRGARAGIRTRRYRRKRENVRRFVLAAELAIQRTNGCTAGHKHIHGCAETHRMSGTQDETIQRAFV
jgi:hypothetical protein